MDISQFKCHSCGNCCRSVYRSSDMHAGFFVSDSEADWLRKAAKEQRIQLSLRPMEAIADKESKKLIVKSWKVNHDACPFFKEGRCTTYDHRPLVCRAFPVVSTGLHGGSAMVRSLVCPQEENVQIPPQPAKMAIETLMHRYNENFLSAFLLEELHFDERGMMEDLMKQGIIKARSEQGGFKPIGLYDYLTTLGLDGGSRRQLVQDEIITLSRTKDKVRALQR